MSLVGTVQDITRRKEAEEELIRLATAVESAADALVITDPRRGIIQYVNPAFVKMTGYSRSEAIGRDLHFLDSGMHSEKFYRTLREALKKDGVWTGRLTQKKKDGTLYEEDCTYNEVRNADGEIINYISIKRDVTERIRLESIAHAMDTMKNIGYIFSGVRHEIGNPVNAIKMNLDLMKKKIGENRGSVAELVDRIQGQVSKIDYLLHGLKNFNMYESLQSLPVEVSSFFDAFLSMVRKDFEKKGISIRSVLDPNAKFLRADPRALQQVLLNILTNSYDALEGRVEPTIVITVSAAETDRIIRIQVKDNGCGIDASRLNDLFKPFNTTKKHGTGLGLVISKKMVVRMNGTVTIASRPGEGTSVEICLPC